MSRAGITANDLKPRPKYYEMDGARLANANRAWLLAFLMAALAIIAVGFAIAVRLQPPTVYRVGANGESSILGKSSPIAVSSADDTYLTEAFVKRFLSDYLNYSPSNVDDHWASALNRMTDGLRSVTLREMKEKNLRGQVSDEQIESVFHLRELDPVPGAPHTFLAYGIKDVHRINNGNETTDHFVNEYNIRLKADIRSERNPDGLWIAEYSERPIDGERRDAILSASDQNSND